MTLSGHELSCFVSICLEVDAKFEKVSSTQSNGMLSNFGDLMESECRMICDLTRTECAMTQSTGTFTEAKLLFHQSPTRHSHYTVTGQ